MMDNKVNETRQNFNLFDKDGSGFLDRNEVKVALESMGDQVTDDEVNGILQQGDVDRDGKISYDGKFTTDLHLSKQSRMKNLVHLITKHFW